MGHSRAEALVVAGRLDDAMAEFESIRSTTGHAVEVYAVEVAHVPSSSSQIA